MLKTHDFCAIIRVDISGKVYFKVLINYLIR